MLGMTRVGDFRLPLPPPLAALVGGHQEADDPEQQRRHTVSRSPGTSARAGKRSRASFSIGSALWVSS